MDIHPSCFSAGALQASSSTEVQVQWVHDHVQIEKLETWAKRHLRATDIVVMEAGCNCFETCKRLKKAGVASVVLESFRAGQIADSYLKTDKVDAIKLARIYLSGLAKEVWQPDETCRERREILAAYRKSVSDAVRMRNRITSWLTEHGLRKPKDLRWTRPQGKIWLLASRNWTLAQETIIDTMIKDLCHAQAKRTALERLIAEEVTSDPTMLQLTRICGIRHITAYGIAAVVGDISRFRTPKQLVAYIGLNPKVNDSGIKQAARKLAHNGRKDLRTLITQGAQSVIRQNPRSNQLARWGQALSFRKSKNIAVIAVARKMITSVWYLMCGFFCELVEPEKALVRKITKIALVIGKDTLQKQGYGKTSHFVMEKIQCLTSLT
jgi:transposase